jgi:Tfp pilus assembly protein PilF
LKVNALSNRGVSYCQQGQKKDAEEDWKKALELTADEEFKTRIEKELKAISNLE